MATVSQNRISTLLSAARPFAFAAAYTVGARARQPLLFPKIASQPHRLRLGPFAFAAMRTVHRLKYKTKLRPFDREWTVGPCERAIVGYLPLQARAVEEIARNATAPRLPHDPILEIDKVESKAGSATVVQLRIPNRVFYSDVCIYMRLINSALVLTLFQLFYPQNSRVVVGYSSCVFAPSPLHYRWLGKQTQANYRKPN
jgi:hypothetical protein